MKKAIPIIIVVVCIFTFFLTLACGIFVAVKAFSEKRDTPLPEIVMTNVSAILPPSAVKVRVEYQDKVEVFLP